MKGKIPVLLLSFLFFSASSIMLKAENEEVVFGGGCFWCIEAVFQRIPGVVDVRSGYAGGHDLDPTYAEVCAGITGHAEVVRVRYDSELVKLGSLLEVFWASHDPTTLNRQQNDVGTQYRSIVLYTKPEHKELIEASIVKAQASFVDKIVTEVEALLQFYPAENYHDDYYNQNPNQGYCRFIIAPKLEKLLKSGVIKEDL